MNALILGLSLMRAFFSFYVRSRAFFGHFCVVDVARVPTIITSRMNGNVFIKIEIFVVVFLFN